MYLIQDGLTRVDFEQFVFSGGEVSVKLSQAINYSSWNIIAELKNSEDILTLLMVADVLKRGGATYIELYMPYIPYARQDRVCNFGEAFSLKVFCDLINSVGFDKVTVEDPHSDVAPALLNNVNIYDQATCINLTKDCDKSFTRFLEGATLVSPDAGAEKKILSVCNSLGKSGFISASKVRDPSTGKITSTEVNGGRLSGDYLIVDDICDGGATFIALAQELKYKGADRVGLYVTHGIFSKGKQHLVDNGVDYIYSKNDWTKEEIKPC